MGKKDLLIKNYMKRPEIFADFFNGYVYGGDDVIKASELQELDSESIVMIPGADNRVSETVNRTRDLLKRAILMKAGSVYYCILGLENQDYIHYAMPVRNMLYNAMSYTEQVETIARYNRKNKKCSKEDYLSGFRKEDKILPVVTVTLYWGTKPWDGPVTLKDMLVETDEEIFELVDDVNCNLFSIIDAKEIPKYKTELKELFEQLNRRNDGEAMKKIVSENEKYKHISMETAEVIGEMANVGMPEEDEKGEYNVCKAIMEIREEGIEVGREEGRLLLLVSMVQDGEITLETAAKRLDISREEFKEKMNNYCTK